MPLDVVVLFGRVVLFGEAVLERPVWVTVVLFVCPRKCRVPCCLVCVLRTVVAWLRTLLKVIAAGNPILSPLVVAPLVDVLLALLSRPSTFRLLPDGWSLEHGSSMVMAASFCCL